MTSEDDLASAMRGAIAQLRAIGEELEADFVENLLSDMRPRGNPEADAVFDRITHEHADGLIRACAEAKGDQFDLVTCAVLLCRHICGHLQTTSKMPPEVTAKTMADSLVRQGGLLCR